MRLDFIKELAHSLVKKGAFGYKEEDKQIVLDLPKAEFQNYVTTVSNFFVDMLLKNMNIVAPPADIFKNIRQNMVMTIPLDVQYAPEPGVLAQYSELGAAYPLEVLAKTTFAVSLFNLMKETLGSIFSPSNLMIREVVPADLGGYLYGSSPPTVGPVLNNAYTNFRVREPGADIIKPPPNAFVAGPNGTTFLLPNTIRINMTQLPSTVAQNTAFVIYGIKDVTIPQNILGHVKVETTGTTIPTTDFSSLNTPLYYDWGYDPYKHTSLLFLDPITAVGNSNISVHTIWGLVYNGVTTEPTSPATTQIYEKARFLGLVSSYTQK